MHIVDVFAGLPVSDLEAAVEWHTRLFGRPPDARPMDGLAEWHHAGKGNLQLVVGAGTPGGGLLTLAVDDLEAEAAAVRARGVEVGPIDDTTSDKVLFVTLADPDGNAVTLVQTR